MFPLITEQQMTLTRDAETDAEIKKKKKNRQIVFLNIYPLTVFSVSQYL